jgi:flagellar protein FliS
MRQPHIAAYQEIDGATADPGRRLVLLLEGAERLLRSARRGAERRDAAAFAFGVARANAIVTTLADALDVEAGGEPARNLARLYDFLTRHLSQALVAKSAPHVDEALTVVREIREAFEAAITAERRGPRA